VVTRDVPAHALVAGNPARRMGWVCACPEPLPPSLACASCGLTYRLASPAEGLRRCEPGAPVA
jgi:UDP-2-acetamido-3-amino-2,3-dideoxy-glucuronate N-acetyltransferase